MVGMGRNEVIIQRAGEDGPRLLFIEPYANASHRALCDGLSRHVPARWTLVTLPGRHFRWRLRGAASHLALAVGDLLRQPWDGLVCSAMLNLAELRGLAPELGQTPALAYFHENQMAYPAPGRADARQRERDLFLAWTNLTTAQAAQQVAFNSDYQRREFLAAAGALLAALPDAAPPGLLEAIAAKSAVLPVPLEASEAAGLERPPRVGPLRLLWNHRWHQDKDPEAFFAALGDLAGQGLEFELAVLGFGSGRPPEVFAAARSALGERARQWGAVADRREYWRWLHWADLVVSTALQENQGLAVAEAVWAGCRPLLPRALVYPELYPEACLYPPGRLAAALAPLLADPDLARAPQPATRRAAAALTWRALEPAWRARLAQLTAGDGPRDHG